ncbi:hypothetical protein Pla22_06810 [Rubripirellula amarantea]|uniref:Uncharacterized protein n=1 Tax=Rubripirellula amarantea TaxID=2527999 RepID=A0A5C5WSJ9_9BACT|nr:hypothetical protein Pla22_06810 [Rubripirellula amarantea]
MKAHFLTDTERRARRDSIESLMARIAEGMVMQRLKSSGGTDQHQHGFAQRASLTVIDS